MTLSSIIRECFISPSPGRHCIHDLTWVKSCRKTCKHEFYVLISMFSRIQNIINMIILTLHNISNVTDISLFSVQGLSTQGVLGISTATGRYQVLLKTCLLTTLQVDNIYFTHMQVHINDTYGFKIGVGCSV